MAGILAGSQRGPAPAPEVGPRLRRGRRPSGGPRVGRAGGDPVADHRGGGQASGSTRSTSSPTASSTRPACSSRSSRRRWHGATPASRLSIFGSTLGAGRHRRQRHARAGRRVGARSASGPRRSSSWPHSACPRPTPGPTSRNLRTRAVYDEATDEWVLNGTKTWITNGGIADVHVVVAVGRPRARARGARPASSCRPTLRGCARARSSRRWGSVPRTPPRSCSRT